MGQDLLPHFRQTGLKSEEEASSIKSRQSLRRLVLNGKMGEAIRQTQRLYPELLEPDENADLLFTLKVSLANPVA